MTGLRRRPGPPGTAATQDRGLLRRATWVIALQTGGAVAVVVAIVVGLVYVTSLEARRDAVESKARAKAEAAAAAAAAAGSAGSAGAGSPVVVDGLDSDCSEARVREAAEDLPVGETWFDVCGGPFLGYVEEGDGVRTAAVVSFVDQRDETRRLAQLSLLAGLLGVVAAGGLGWLSARRAVRPLGEALTLQRRFVADAGHELRTPLAILLTRTQLLERTTPAEDPQREELHLLAQDARIMGEVIDDLLLVTELRDRRPTFEPVDVVALSTSVRESYAARAAAHQVDLTVVATVPEILVDGAPTPLRRALAALVDNALAHASPGGAVTVRLDAEDTHARIAVLDDGSGLDPALADGLTRRFERGLVPDGGDQEHRLGLGLALVREIVESHGGRLQIEGAPGVGAGVTLHLPQRRPASDP